MVKTSATRSTSASVVVAASGKASAHSSPICAGERPLQAVGLEPVQRPGVDLRLDARLTQRGECVVAAVELDYSYTCQPCLSPSAALGVSRKCSSRSVYQRATRSLAARSSSSHASCGMPMAQEESDNRGS